MTRMSWYPLLRKISQKHGFWVLASLMTGCAGGRNARVFALSDATCQVYAVLCVPSRPGWLRGKALFCHKHVCWVCPCGQSPPNPWSPQPEVSVWIARPLSLFWCNDAGDFFQHHPEKLPIWIIKLQINVHTWCLIARPHGWC